MKSTALGAENIIFISDAHEKFYYEKLQEVRYQDVYHKALSEKSPHYNAKEETMTLEDIFLYYFGEKTGDDYDVL